MKRLELLIATKNKGKIQEFKNMLKDYPVQIKTLYDYSLEDIEETGTTFYENALIKAKAGYKESGLITIADDSGLEVDALNGSPGVYSARYGGNGLSDQERIEFLLKNMTEEKNRKARFKTSLILYVSEEETFHFEGVWEGEILDTCMGEHGFGYDPVFYDPKLQKSAAELTKDEKKEVSHRGKAMKALSKDFENVINRVIK